MASQLPPPEAKSLPDGPSDGVTALSYLPKESSTHLVSTSWDGSVRIHDTASRSAVLSHVMNAGPLLSLACPTGMDAVVVGGLDGSIRLLDIPTTTPTLVGQLTANAENKVGCSCLASCGADNSPLIASAGWNGHFQLWDIRQSSSSTGSAVSSLELPGKAFAMDIHLEQHRVVVATSGRRTCIVDIRNPTTPELVLDRESSLKFQTRCVQFFPDGHSLALGSVEGRVGIEFFEELALPASMKKYAFKCHRVNDTVYPVNCIAFHPRILGTFATGGCDGTVVFWDGTAKKKLTTLPSFPTSISAMAFNHDGSEIAVASSYTHEEGDRAHPKDEIFTREVLDSECLPKPK